MVFTPNPNLFTDAASGGIRVGASLADLFQRRQDRKRLGQLAQLFQQGDYNGVGAGLIEMGQVSPGVSVANIPYEREQQALQREFQNAQFMDSRDFRRQQFAATQEQQALQNSMQAERMDMERRRFEAEMDPNNPLNAVNENWTTPTQAVGPDGQPVFIQTSNRGGVRQVEGFAPSNPIKTIDTGTEIVTVDSRTNAILSRTPKQNYLESYDKEAGKGAAQSAQDARANLPKVEGQASQMLDVISRLEKHPGMNSALGVIQGNLPAIAANPMNPQAVADFRAIKGQLEGQAFLQAFESLKGGGQITEIEGRKATDAIAAMSNTQSPEEFRRQLGILKGVIQQGVMRARKSAQGGAPGSPNAETVNVPSPMLAGKSRQSPIPVTSEAEADQLPSGTWVILDGRVGQVE